MRGFRERTSVPVALAMLSERVGPLAAEAVPLADAAGRVAAEDVSARANVPHFARAAMDGFALVAASITGASASLPIEIPILGDALPGRPFAGAIQPGQAVRITTGAPVPAGADAVLMAEHADEIDRDGARVLRAREPIASGKHVGAIGEDVRAGAIVVTRGRRLRPQDLGVLASVGVPSIQAVRRPRVCIVITGDELLPPGSMPEGPFIVDANSLMLEALANRDGAASVSIVRVRDRRELVRAAIAEAPEEVVLVSGGSSVGPEDHAPLVLAEIGEVTVHGVAMRPSSPAGFGFFGEGRKQMAFLLPGNPVSCLCAYEFFAGPSIRVLGGLPRAWPHPRVRCRVKTKIASERGRTDYVRVKVEGDEVTPIMLSGASILSSTTRADGVVIVGEGDAGHDEGEIVEVLLY
ncbi:Molybdopterin biosynthesis protein MoeA [Minicystis rosea]|nr:Molybdopterin biosynthesis protein MoeA [Minicystis rosea]